VLPLHLDVLAGVLVPTDVITLPQFCEGQAGCFIERLASVYCPQKFGTTTIGQRLRAKRLRVWGIAGLPAQFC
jgi:hypothetical protein